MGFPFLLPAPRLAKCTIREYRIPYHHFERMPTSAPSGHLLPEEGGRRGKNPSTPFLWKGDARRAGGWPKEKRAKPTSAPSTASFQRKEGECRFSCIAISSERAALLSALRFDFSLFLPKVQVPCYNG